ncbi:4-hydroxy-tetrahydrodipicolinate reductase [Candidatus Rubidus massiliensis]|nr:4-hydroxy-tetrahydrodipicolinate reductase [Candidatus Rubidus massiliensis]
MKIGLVGYGKMGKMLEELIHHKNWEVGEIYTERNPLTIHAKVDVFIDFSNAAAFLQNFPLYCTNKIPVVVGTTGWDHHIEEIKAEVNRNNFGMIYSPNFSIGVHLFLKILASASSLINNFPSYDVAASEIHHSDKKDHPSGTSKEIIHTLMKHIDRKNETLFHAPHGKIDPHQLHFSSLRLGSVIGKHEVYFSSPFDMITLTHDATNRQGFAEGALQAASWIQDKKGFYTIENLINEMQQAKVEISHAND